MSLKKPQKQTEYKYRCVYTGRIQEALGNKIWQRFERLDNKKEMFFKGIKGVKIGFTYECGATYISSRPKRIWEVSYIDNPSWEARDLVVKGFLDKRRAEARINAKSGQNIRELIKLIEPFVTGLDMITLNSFIKAVCNKAYDNARKGNKHGKATI